MDIDSLQKVSSYFVPGKKVKSLHPVGIGHIHKTYKVELEGHFPIIIQKINTTIFKDVHAVLSNMLAVSSHLKNTAYPYSILEPLPVKNGYLLEAENNQLWRAFPFIENTIAIEKAQSPRQAYEAAKAFGTFLSYLDGLDPRKIKDIIPGFHNLDLRFQLFQEIYKNDPFQRNKTAISEVRKAFDIMDQYSFDFKQLPLRIVHNDTKISNILLNKANDKGVCVIDLDTIMPGIVVTDFGDMVRTFCCTVDENEKNLESVEIDLQIFEAMAKGFLEPTKKWLTNQEAKNLLNGGIYIIFEQAIRFLTDYLKGDEYYPVDYEKQNLDRCRNQLKLLQSVIDEKEAMGLIINSLLK